jgi:hypothetical protein
LQGSLQQPGISQGINMDLINKKIGPWEREELVTNDIPFREIPGLYSSEDHGIPDVLAKMESMTKAEYSHEEIFGKYCHLGEYIEVPLDIVFEYAANAFSLEEWSFSIRQCEHIGGGIYKGLEMLANDTPIYLRSDAYPDSGVVDYLCAWDQGDELWMRYYFRFVDAMPTIGKPGTIVLWTNCKHPYYDKNTDHTVPTEIKRQMDREDRTWVGDMWPGFDAIHKIEMSNLKRILEYRYQNAGPQP